MNCHVRMLNASPEMENINIYVNDTEFVNSLNFKEFTAYTPAEEGIYRFKVISKVDGGKVLYEENIELSKDVIYTLAFTGMEGEYFFEPILDELSSKAAEGESEIRFINLSPNNETFNIYLNKAIVVSDLEYMESGDYLGLPPGKYALDIKNAFGESKMYHPNMNLKEGNNYTGYIVGGNEILLPLEGSSYI